MPSLPNGDASRNGAPLNVTSICQDGAAIISWAMAAPDSAITNFTVTPYIAGVAQATTNLTVSGGTVSGLTNGTTYTFTAHTNFANGTRSPESAPSGPNTPLAGLVFGDEFKNTTLDPHWIAITRDSDQSNSELSYHVPQNVIHTGDFMQLTATNTPTTNYEYSDTSYPAQNFNKLVTRNYTSAMVQTAPTPAFIFTSGKTLSVRVRALMPAGVGTTGGVWAAIWMLGANCQATNLNNPDNVGACNWPASGSDEVDIAEWNPAFPGGTSTTRVDMDSFVAGSQVGPYTATMSDASQNFHEYRLDWNASGLTWFLDGVQTATQAQHPTTAMFLILGMPIIAPNNSFYPASMLIDYVHIFNS